MKRKAPWHSPSECSFDFGFRLGVLTGKIRAFKKAQLYCPDASYLEAMENDVQKWKKELKKHMVGRPGQGAQKT